MNSQIREIVEEGFELPDVYLVVELDQVASHVIIEENFVYDFVEFVLVRQGKLLEPSLSDITCL